MYSFAPKFFSKQFLMQPNSPTKMGTFFWINGVVIFVTNSCMSDLQNPFLISAEAKSTPKDALQFESWFSVFILNFIMYSQFLSKGICFGAASQAQDFVPCTFKHPFLLNPSVVM